MGQQKGKAGLGPRPPLLTDRRVGWERKGRGRWLNGTIPRIAKRAQASRRPEEVLRRDGGLARRIQRVKPSRSTRIEREGFPKQGQGTSSLSRIEGFAPADGTIIDAHQASQRFEEAGIGLGAGRRQSKGVHESPGEGPPSWRSVKRPPCRST